MNQDYVRPKSPLSLSPSPPPLLRVDGGAQSTRWSLTVRYLTAKEERRREASARARGYIYRQYIRPISAPLSVLFLLTRPAPLLTLVRRRRERERERAAPFRWGKTVRPYCFWSRLSSYSTVWHVRALRRALQRLRYELFVIRRRPAIALLPFGKWQVVHCLSLLPILQ